MQKSLYENTITIMGSGTSTGVPLVGCSCPVCTSLDHRDQRLRTSLFIETKNGQRIIVDTGPDLRTQLLANKISAIDFAIITHEHADHLHGIDDLRPFSFGPPVKEIPVFTNAPTKAFIEERYPYIIQAASRPSLGGGVPRLNIQAVEMEKTTTINGEDFFFFSYPHGYGVTMGFIHDTFAYVVDCFELPDHLIKILKEKKLKLLIIDCLQRRPHQTHLTVEKCFHYIKEIKPERAGLIHMSHDLSHRGLADMAQDEFGKNVFPLYDQQKITYEGT
ncbi:MAG: MBL fold metallo-hydrolase [Rhizobacter sp.]|nr:MBL fold metallo-hydrolase [Bacteriovorax sp.]